MPRRFRSRCFAGSGYRRLVGRLGLPRKRRRGRVLRHRAASSSSSTIGSRRRPISSISCHFSQSRKARRQSQVSRIPAGWRGDRGAQENLAEHGERRRSKARRCAASSRIGPTRWRSRSRGRTARQADDRNDHDIVRGSEPVAGQTARRWARLHTQSGTRRAVRAATCRTLRWPPCPSTAPSASGWVAESQKDHARSPTAPSFCCAADTNLG